MQIFIDADGCPVVDVTCRIAAEYGIPVTVVCDTAHEIAREGVRVITVEKGKDSVDFRLANALSRGDIAVTGDYGLAAMCLAKGGTPLSQNGLVFTEQNMDGLLFSRYVSQKVRRAGGRLKGPSKRTDEQTKAFEAALRRLIGGTDR